MTEDLDWNDEIGRFDALAETRIMWLRLGRRLASIVENCGDWMDDRAAADEVMGWAARAEACLWRATRDADAIEAHVFIPELARLPAAVLAAIDEGEG